MIINSKLGSREIDEQRIITFPRGIIGFEDLRRFTLLQIREESPFLVLQSIETPSLGLLVADPFSFLDDYSLHIGDQEQALLKAKDEKDIAVLVTATIPPGKPAETVLNLLGPIIINHDEKIGLQVPQTDNKHPARVFIYQQDALVKENTIHPQQK